MNKLGLHMLVYTPEWNQAGARLVCERANAFGFDFVEVLIFDPATTDAEMTAATTREYGVDVVAAVCGDLDADISSPDPEVFRRGEERIAQSISVARDMGATMLAGPTYSALRRYDGPPSDRAFDQAVSAFSRLAKKADEAGVRIGLEAVNRYESNFVNTIGQAADICRAVGSDALFVHGDVFHMNIEEADVAAAIASVSDTLGYVHLTESHRGPLGEGNYDWHKFFGALVDIDYQGPITFETFSPQVLGPELSNLLALWRVPWSNPDVVAGQAKSFVQQHLADARLRVQK